MLNYHLLLSWSKHSLCNLTQKGIVSCN